MAGYYIHVPPPEERGGLTVNELFASGMPCYFGSRDLTSNPGNLPDNCVLCWEKLGPEASYRRLPCSHIFHLSCIDLWLCEEDASCPLCRKTFYYLRGPRGVYIGSQRGSYAPELPVAFYFKAAKAWFSVHCLGKPTRHGHIQ
ncbi:RING finger protein [Aspergillus puulaauensis]|uniref:RING-type domain-containing protein n=1 Tax=Aspergillus puulaauensis TaxID=1220207 RepID=A0A7R7XCS8_9EURO|nr:uncharacterized protein APUU_11698A [Aspergillus puulaauensis]BCS18870.1 hypothetical protein APUU_11698A [Aspergillus puulaauensis]